MAPRSESSNSESSSESESDSVKQPTNIASGSNSSEDSDSDSEMENASGENDSDNSAESSESDDEEPAPAESTTHPSAIPPTEFRPPSGFKAPKSQTTPSNAVSSALSNLRNKQIFHITAPSLLPLSKVKEVSLAKIMQGEPVLVHDGVSYGIPPEDLSQQDPNEKTLLLYETKAHTYFRAPTSDIQSYHVQEMVNIPRQLNSEPPNTSIVMNPPKLQPKHLKMRFRPVGSRNAPPETLGSSSESEREISTAKKSQGEERKRKHPHHEIDGSQPGAVSRKKSKKQPSSQEDGLSSSQFTTVPISPSTDERGRDKAKKPKKNREETSQERRARREEKKKKKADKVA